MKNPRARLVGTLPNGRRVYRVPVVVRFNDSRLCATVRSESFDVLAYSPYEAANWARAHVATRPETEVYAYGPKGGTVRRYVGWDSAIFARLCEPNLGLLPLDFGGETTC